MIRKKIGNIEWLEFELLQKCPVTHGVFLRGERLDFSQGEEKEEVKNVLGISKMTFANQEHGPHVEIVKDGELNADGLITLQKGIGLTIRHADCQAAIFYDRKNHLLANVHAGWRGQVANIYKRALEKLKSEYKTDPADIIVCITPSLGPRNAEFIHYEREFPEPFWDFRVRRNHFDLWALAKWQLMELGVKEESIEIAHLCTYEREGDFYSYRRDRTKERNATIAALQ